LLEGLEVSELLLSTVAEDNKSLRIDSNYFIKLSIALDRKIKTKPHFFLKDKEVASGPFGSTLKSHAYLTEGVPFVRVQNIKGGFEIKKNEIVYISEQDNAVLRNSQLFVDDLVLSKVGNSIGYYARVDEELQRCNISENNIGIKLSVYPRSRRHYILTFLNTKFGEVLTLRKISGNAQPKLNVSDVSDLPIPLMGENFEAAISNLIIQSREIKHRVESIYTQAEILLLNALGMADFSPSAENVNIKSFKDSFLATGRLDAEYYQPKYEGYQKRIVNYANGWDYLIKICNLKDSNFNPKDNQEYQYVELANIDKSGGITDCIIAAGKELPSRARRKVQNGDVLISSVEGSLASCAIVSNVFDGALCSTGFYVINSSIMNSETLLVLFKSDLMQNILKQSCSGTILTAINKSEFSNIPVPIIEIEIQTQIADLIQQSFSLKADSERLLAAAKRAVEIAIETDEPTALAYINNQTGK